MTGRVDQGVYTTPLSFVRFIGLFAGGPFPPGSRRWRILGMAPHNTDLTKIKHGMAMSSGEPLSQ